MKDILVDNTVAKNFANPMDPEYKIFVQWLVSVGVLVVTQRLLVEYYASSATSPAATSMPAIVNTLLRDGRLIKYTKAQLAAQRFSRATERKLLSNTEDHGNIKAVLLSVRKLALSHDKNFLKDLERFKRQGVVACSRPDELPFG